MTSLLRKVKTPTLAGARSGSRIGLPVALPIGFSPSSSQNNPASESQPYSRLKLDSRVLRKSLTFFSQSGARMVCDVFMQFRILL
jgi:hypothetical protein